MNDASPVGDEFLDTFLNASGRQKLKAYLDALVTKLVRHDFKSAFDLAKEVYGLLLHVVGSVGVKSPAYLMKVIRAVGKRLVFARPVELVVGNAVRRVLFLIREECLQLVKDEHKQQRGESGSSPDPKSKSSSNGEDFSGVAEGSRRDVGLHAILTNRSTARLDCLENKDLRPAIIDGLNEMLEELENMYEPISKQALEHVHANEIILVYGMSISVQKFLEAAKRKRNFEVIVAEAFKCEGHTMAKALSERGIRTTVITDSAIMAMMSRVNKVLMGAKAVLANGAILTRSGAHLVALAARHHRVPLVCVTGLYKLSPLYAHDVHSFNDLKSPGSVLDYGEIDSENIQVLAPASDYVPPDLVSLFITNNGGHQPSYVYRLLHEYYHPEDTVL